ncbi:MAG: hypothetical protein KDB14_32730, partial [Planctomycetales bacterium]|nr:hypothetical protein [Planctomycetales bacterium]
MLSDLLDQIREYYLTRLVDVINDHGERDGVQVAYEVAFCDDDGEIATEGELDLPCRADLIVVENGEVADSVQVDTAEMLSFDALDFVWPDTSLNVHLEP